MTWINQPPCGSPAGFLELPTSGTSTKSIVWGGLSGRTSATSDLKMGAPARPVQRTADICATDFGHRRTHAQLAIVMSTAQSSSAASAVPGVRPDEQIPGSCFPGRPRPPTAAPVRAAESVHD